MKAEKERRRPNLSQKRSLRREELCLFVQQYGRKAQKRTEPNDRKYSRETEVLVRRMNPLLLDQLLRDEDE